MIHKLKQFFDSRIQSPLNASARDGAERALQLATVALMFEVVRADFEVKESERRAVLAVAQRFFQIDDAQIAELAALAEREAEHASSLFQFTQLVDKRFTPEQKLRVVEMLWRVAFADGHRDKHEEHLVSKVADLLHVPRAAYLAARHRVEQELRGVP